jgi:hypothetical protein
MRARRVAVSAIAVGAIIGIFSLLFDRSAILVVAQEAEEFPATLRADSYRFDRQAQIITAEGHVVLTARDVTLQADLLVASLQTGVVTAEGHVLLTVAGQSVAAEMLTYNLHTHVGTLFNARTEYRSPLILGAVRLRVEELTGDLARFVTIRKGFVTTCEEPDPIVFATADELQIYPNDKVVGRGVSLWVAGHRILTVPYFIIFLRERRETRIAPVVGYSDAEGVFVLTAWSYFLNENHYGFVHADWFDRLGIGMGIEHLYRFGGGEGSALVYRLANRQTGGPDVRTILNHLQRLGDVTARAFIDNREQSSATPPPTSSLFASLDLSTQTQQSSTYLYGTLSQSSVGPVSTVTSRFADLRSLGPRLAAESFLDYSRNAGPAGIDEALFPRSTLRFFGEGLTATLVTETRWNLGTPFSANLYVLERLPELTLSPSAFRVGDSFLLGQGAVGWAQFRETTPGPTGRVLNAGRADVQVTISGPIPMWGGTVGMRTFARESWYTTGDTRVFYGGRLEYAQPIGAVLDATVGYTGQTAVGTSPFVFDQIAGTLSLADTQLTYHTQDLLVRATGFYDFQARQYGNVVGQVFFVPQPNWSIGLAASYNVNVGRLDRAEASLDLPLSKDWHLEYSGAWDSVTQRVFQNRISVTRTFCDCMAVSLTYLGARNEIWLEAWLTAIPWGRGKIGIGSQGTLLFEQPWWLVQPR